MWQYKTELADLSFKYLFPKEYGQLDYVIASRFQSYQATLASAKAELEDLLTRDRTLRGRMRSISVVGRTKSIYSTWKKMQRHVSHQPSASARHLILP